MKWTLVAACSAAALTRDQAVTYTAGHGRGVQGSIRPHPAEPARRAVRAGRPDAQRARGAPSDDAVRRHEAPEGARGGEARGDQAAGSREAALPESRPDPAGPRQVGEQVRGALGGRAVRAQARPRKGGDDGEGVRDLHQDHAGAAVAGDHRQRRTRQVQLRRRCRVRLVIRLELPGRPPPRPTCRGAHPRAPGTLVKGENLEVDPPRRLVQSFTALWSDDVKAQGASRVTWEIEPVGDSCRLTVTHDQLRDGAHDEVYGGWPQILSGLKTLLETGEDLTTPGALMYAQA